MIDATLKAEEKGPVQEEPWALRENEIPENKDVFYGYDPSKPYQGVEEPDMEVEFSEASFPVTEGNVVHLSDPVHHPIRVVYKVREECFEVEDWGLTIPLENFPEIPDEIGRRFFQLYCASQDGTLARNDEKILARISKQMDYRRFAATRLVPRRLEATLIRTEPVTLIEFLDERSVKLTRKLGKKLGVLKDGDRFAAYFDLDGDGDVLDLRNIDLLPPLDSMDLESAFDSGVE